MHYFITGTDTNAGKTYVTCLLLQSLRRAGRRAVGYKPVCCGDRMDAHAILHACAESDLTLDAVNPAYLKAPAAPYVAGLLENRSLSHSALRAGFEALATQHETVLVEGAGGWEVPLTAHSTMADLAHELGLPVIVVVNNKLGALNHTLLTVQAIERRGLTVAGIILNHVADERDPASISNRAMLQHFLPHVVVLADVMHGETELEIELP
jgi:dethiobiotin synthetase